MEFISDKRLSDLKEAFDSRDKQGKGLSIFQILRPLCNQLLLDILKLTICSNWLTILVFLNLPDNYDMSVFPRQYFPSPLCRCL